MKREILIVALLFPIVAQAQDYKAFGGVWIGQTDYKDGETPSLNVGSFFLAETPFVKNLHFGYAVSANTSIAIDSATGFDNSGHFVSASLTGIGVHVPLEFNLAYVYSLGKLRLWGGGGVNLSIAQATLNLSYSDFTNGYTCNASATGETKLTQGFQLFGGGEYIFGGLPVVGGQWGIFAQLKYMYVNKVDMAISGNVECVDTSENVVNQSIDESIEIDLTNTSFVAGLTYHF